MSDPNNKPRVDYELIEMLKEQTKEHVEALSKRPIEALATALIFSMSELLFLKDKRDNYEDGPMTLPDLILEASKEALTLTDEVYLAKPASDTEIIH
tara:strand:- start:2235 stop:2525 length:291 start_codon:yes stop_codon:yes gene_type:complete